MFGVLGFWGCGAKGEKESLDKLKIFTLRSGKIYSKKARILFWVLTGRGFRKSEKSRNSENRFLAVLLINTCKISFLEITKWAPRFLIALIAFITKWAAFIWFFFLKKDFGTQVRFIRDPVTHPKNLPKPADFH